MLLNNFFLNDLGTAKYLLFLIICLIIFSFVSYFTNIIFIKLNILDFPNKRKSHLKPVPISGGTILTVTSTLIYFFLTTKIDFAFYSNIIFISFIFYIFGLIDDLKNPRTSVKTLIIILILIISLLRFDDFVVSEIRFNYFFGLNLSLGYLSIPFTLFCIFMFFNALNYADGKNGICISYSIFVLFFISIINSNISIYEQLIILSLVVLLIFNLKNSLFLGNNGVNFLSVFLSLLIIKTYNLGNNNFFCDEILLLMFLPGLDAARVTILRIYKKISPVTPDKRHFHHYLSIYVNDKYIWIIYLILASIPIVILKISEEFLISILFPTILYSFLIFKSFKH